MKIIISPAKKMNIDTDSYEIQGLPVFLEQTGRIMEWVRQLSREEAKKLWKCNDKLTDLNFERFRKMDLKKCLTPAIISYEGIQYQYMSPGVMETRQLAYIQEHVRILSGFYGVLKPFDGVVPYRLEMQAKASVGGTKDLYDYWGDALYRELMAEEQEKRAILNLASREYAKAVEPYLSEKDIYITCVFGELQGDKVVQKGTMAKMARGEMVNFLAGMDARSVENAKQFDRLGYRYREELSDEKEYVFIKE